ncbi:PqqD family protein [Sphingomonas sp.]|uniref:PqqD family protein n=1 Tax=Sphingomonas sp. TaxID=28214 RepID=UPI001DD3E099|nr:PqqD family protein [Sphingomonas sp.]MBX9797088.1 PqqD family peptide modification chaperone [Sphingomonas sp.]
MQIIRSTEWLSAKVGDEVMMMSAASGVYMGLDAIAARIWDLLEEPSDIDSLCARLVGEFEVEPDECRRDVEAFLDDLARQGAVTLAGAQA